ncbi:MAG: hypothetical protein U0V03_00505 [Bacteroidia bacterium]
MRILLYNELSGVHFNLSEGLKKLGHDVTIASGGDGWKKFRSDISLNPSKNSKLGRVKYRIELIKKLTGFDVIQIMGGMITFGYEHLDNYIIKYILKNNKNAIYLAAGCEAQFYNYSNFNKSPVCIHCKLEDSSDNKCPIGLHNDYYQFNCETIIKNVNKIFAIGYDYQLPYQNTSNFNGIINMPINTDKICYKTMPVGQKIKILHGINRKGFKGSTLILNALNKLREKYPNDIEVMTPSRLNFNEYLKVLETSDLVVDQGFFYSLGMNALISMAMGKVVLQGFKFDGKNEYLNSKPSITFDHNEAILIREIETLIADKKKISEIGYNSRVFVEKNHNYISVAEDSIKKWKAEIT